MKRAPQRRVHASKPSLVLLVPAGWFALGFFTIATVFFLVWWDRFPIVPHMFLDYWRRERPFLVPVWSVFITTWFWNAASMFLLVAVQCVGWALGRCVLRWVVGCRTRGLWGLLLALGLGNGLLGTFTLGLGFNGLLQPGVVRGGLVAAALAAVWFVVRRRAWPGLISSGEKAPCSPETRVTEAAPRRDAAKVAGWLERGFVWTCGFVAFGSLAGLLTTYVASLDQHGATAYGPWLFVGLAALAVTCWCAAVGRHRSGAARVTRWVEYALMAFCALVVGGSWLSALQPEWHYDSLVYHLAVPEQYLLNHKIHYVGHTFISNYPFQQEMRYLLFLALGSDLAPKLQHWMDGVLSAVAVYTLAWTFLGRTAAWLAAAVFLSQPTLRFLQHVTMVELGLTWFEMLATMAFVGGMGWLRPRAPGCVFVPRGAWFMLAGWFLGFAHGTKYIGLLASGLLLCWLSMTFIRSGRGGRPLFRALALIIAGASIWTSVWLAKNWLFTGDPVFPFMGSVFPTLNWDDANQALWMGDNTKYGTGHGSLRNWLQMPVAVSSEISAFGTFTVNPFALLFLPLLFLCRGPPGVFRFLAVYVGLYFLLWSVLIQQVRFLFPVMAQAAVAVAFVVTRLGQGSRLVQGLIGSAAAWILVMSAYGQIQHRQLNSSLIPYVTGHLDRTGLLRTGVSYYNVVERANRLMDSRARLLFVGSDESLYCERNRLCNSIYDRQELREMAMRAQSPAELLAMLRRRRISHMLLHVPRCEEYVKYGMFDWDEHAKRNFLDMWHTYGRMVFVSNRVFLFEFKPEPLPLRARKTGTPLYFHAPENARRASELILATGQLIQRQLREKALNLCHEIVRLVPGAGTAHSLRAYAYGLLNRRAEAVAGYETAIRLGYPTAFVYFNLAVLLEDDGQHAAALNRYLEAIELDPQTMGTARRRAADLALRLKRYPLALELIEDSLAVDPGNQDFVEKAARIRKLAAVD